MSSSAPPSPRAFADRSPVFKVGVLLVGVLLAALVARFLGRLSGAHGEWAQPGDRNLGQFLFLAGAVLFMSLDRLPLHVFGMAVGARWKHRLLGGLAVGLGVSVLYYGVAEAVGALDVRWDRFSSSAVQVVVRVLRACARATMAQVVACGYVFGLLKGPGRLLPAALGAGVLFGLFYDPAAIPSILQGSTAPAFLGVVLGVTFLCLLRAALGSILAGVGVLTSWLWVQDLLRRGRMLHAEPDADATLVAWLAPDREILAAPAFWLLLGLGIAVLLLRLARHGEPAAPSGARTPLPRSFKRVYPFAQPMAFAPLDVWIGRLLQARGRVGLAYLPRLITSLVLSFGNTLLSLPERVLLPLVLRGRTVPDPIFVVGTHRSGTTHLHNLLALDPALVPPRLYQVSNPRGFLFSGWLAVPLMACAPSRRPMDNMAMHVFAPSEDEFAIANACGLSPYWGAAFPCELAHYDGFIHPEDWSDTERRRWNRIYLDFCRRLTLFTRRRPVFKNPYHTARVGHLHALFPGARFVHIVRNPADVYRSNMKLNDEGFLLFQLQDPDPRDSFEQRFPEKYCRMEAAYERDAARLPAEQVAEVRFEDLERDPIGTIEQIYATWGVPLSPAYRAALEAYVASLQGYRKNVHKPLDPALAATLETGLAPLLSRWGYALPGSERETPAARNAQR